MRWDVIIRWNRTPIGQIDWASLIVLSLKGEVKAKIKISPVVVFGVLSRMVVVRGS